MFKVFASFIVAAGLLLPANALATPDMAKGAADRFAAMDTSKDGKVTWEEFSAYYPKMARAAFDTIDSSKDGFIDEEEWKAFSSGHSRDMGRQGGMGGQSSMPGQKAPDSAAPKAPNDGQAPDAEKKKSLPLLPLNDK